MRKQTLIQRAVRRNGIIYRGGMSRYGHPMRAEEGTNDSGGTADSGGGDNNQQGNAGNSSGGNANPGSQGNNAGAEFDAGSFWNSPPEEAPSPGGNPGSAGGNPSGGNQGQNEGNAFASALGSLTFGESQVFTPEAVAAMNDGNPKNFNDNMTTFGREVTRQAVIMAAQLMQKNNTSLESKFDSMMQEKFGARDTETDLGKEIPSYSKPGMKPIVDGIMAQALRLSKGKRPEAIAMTKEMLKMQATQLGQDFNITTPPGGAGNDFGTGQTTNWEEELLGR